MLYVGSNDGFLHGIRASDGVELLAYMPSSVYANISKLTAQNYTHRYFVDESPAVQDIKFGGAWHSVLVSGLGAGGRGLIALDVTNPANFTEANADAISMWEFNSSSDADLGYTFGTPAIVNLNNGVPGVIVGNGYNNSGSGESGIFILNAQTGAVIKKILTGLGSAGTPNGVGPVTAIDTDGDSVADTVYAGDLRGRLWKFDISNSNPASWDVAFSGDPLFVADNGTAQPITAAPEVTLHPNGGYLVIFGTGQYLAIGDPANTSVQSLYGVRDNGNDDLDRSDLVAQTVTGTQTLGGKLYRNVSTNPINWATDDGWRLDLPESGERSVVDPVLRFGRAVFVTLTPNADPCSAGGSSWIMEIDYLTGGQVSTPTLDTDNNNVVNGSDTVVAGVHSDTISSNITVFERGDGTEDKDGNEDKFSNTTAATILKTVEAGGSLSRRRTSWRQER
jgi:type IV pilus assembly protein PilY1